MSHRTVRGFGMGSPSRAGAIGDARDHAAILDLDPCRIVENHAAARELRRAGYVEAHDLSLAEDETVGMACRSGGLRIGGRTNRHGSNEQGLEHAAS